MGSTRTKNSIKNVGYGLAMQLVAVLVNFITRTILVRLLGMDVNGLNGLFTEVIAMLSLVEMGVGAAITYNLFRPLATHDEQKLCQLMTLFRKAYRIIAATVLGIGLLLTPVAPLLVNGTDFTASYIRLIFLLFVLQTASTYLFSYKTSLLIADQKNYIVTVITTIFRVLLMVVNTIVLVAIKNYIIYLAVQIVFNLLSNLVISITADRRYPFLKRKEQLPRDEQKGVLSNIKHLFISSLSGKITNSTDNILISVLVSTTEVGIYTNYALIMTAIKNLFIQVMSAMSGSVGNLLTTESPERCHQVLKRMTFMFFICASLATTGMFCVATPFVQLFFGAQYLLGDGVLFVCVVNLFFFILREPLWKVMNVSGLFAKLKYVSILGTVINLIVSLALGYFYGTIGIFIGTTCTLVIQFVLNCILVYRDRFELPAMPLLIYTGKMVLLILALLPITRFTCDLIVFPSLILTVLARGSVSVFITVGVIWLFYGRSNECNYFILLLRGFLTKKRAVKEVDK